MAYQKRNFVKEQLLTAADLNAMDEQIAKNEKEIARANDDVGLSLRFQRTLTSTDDLNTLRTTGIYDYYQSSIPTNTPFGVGVTAVVIYVMSGKENYPTLQVAVGNNVMKYRANHTNVTTGWGSWKNTESDIEVLDYSGDRTDAVMTQRAVKALVDNETSGIDNAIKASGDAVIAAANASQIADEAKQQVSKAVVGNRYLTKEDHLDNITDQGIYAWLNGDPPSGRPLEYETGDPTPRSALMVVYNFDYQVVQIVYEQITARIATRTKRAYVETWSEWNYSTEIVQFTGSSEYKVMSQAAVTNRINLLQENIENITGSGGTDSSGADYSDVINVLKLSMTSGVFVTEDADALRPTAIGGMKVETKPGTMLIQGYSKKVAKATRTFITTDTERVAVELYRLNTNTGEITAIWRDVKMFGSDIILSPEDGDEIPLRGGGYYDILICKVTIPANALEITADMVEDLRPNENYCGYVRSKL